MPRLWSYTKKNVLQGPQHKSWRTVNITPISSCTLVTYRGEQQVRTSPYFHLGTEEYVTTTEETSRYCRQHRAKETMTDSV